MTNITKAAQDALEAMERYQVKRQDFERFADEVTALRAALQDKAGEVRGERDAFEQWLGIKPCGAAHDFGWQAWKARAAQPAPVVPDDHPLVVFAKECRLGAYTEREVIQEAGKALAASQQKG